ncbi:MAG: hypothetical protein K9N23_02400 [Akkermansiaceae bacterium]|nr:hypothetical protein [Akkermansiaceae bacterium]MCF7730502.1 hypothetical protein [Akkermansiaceae bacterium]
MEAQFFIRGLLFAAGLLRLANLDATAATDQTSGFDVDTENWRASDAGTTLAWQATGGATGAYLKATGPGGEWHLLSPSAWAGDWSAYRALKFDLAITSRHYADTDRAAMVVIAGADSATMTWHGPTPLWTWTHYEVSLDPQSFGVDQATFDGIMADVAEVRILAEFSTASETVGLDNVRLTATPVTVHSQNLVETFTGAVKEGVNVNGWKPVDDVTLTPNIAGVPLYCLYGDDWQDGRTFRVASPDSWAGNWSNFAELSFDMKWQSNGSGVGGAELVQIFGANGTVLTWGTVLTEAAWEHIVVPLTAATFGVDEATFQSVMSYVNKVQIKGEFDTGNDLLWLDNVILATGPVVPRVFETSLTSRFGGDAEGWTVFDGATLGWDATGGFTGAAITSHDEGTGTARFCSPDAWSGDWRGFQSLKFMLKLYSNSTAGYPPVITIYGFNGATLTLSPPVPYPTWSPYTIDLTPETFGVAQAEFDAVIGNVAHLTIVGDLINGNDTTGLDDVSLLASGTPTTTPPEHLSEFDSDGEGWRKGGRISSSTEWGLLTSPPAYRDDGNPGGCIAVDDEYSLTHWFSPAAWAGDWRGYESVAFDLKIISGTALLEPGTMLAVISVHGTMMHEITAPPTLGQWNHYEFALNPVAFGVTPEEFNTIMRDVTMLAIRAEWINYSETEALDNVRLSKAPEAYWLWLASYLDAAALADESQSAKTADPDGDGASNWDEYLALTVPTDPQSRFTATAQAAGPGGFVIEYPTRSGRVYQVWKSTDPSAPGSWTAVGPMVPGDDHIKTHADPATEPAAFFRVGVGLP